MTDNAEKTTIYRVLHEDDVEFDVVEAFSLASAKRVVKRAFPKERVHVFDGLRFEPTKIDVMAFRHWDYLRKAFKNNIMIEPECGHFFKAMQQARRVMDASEKAAQ